MATHGITATYQPFSLQERLAPIQMMKEEYDKINEQLAAYGDAANEWQQYVDPNTEAGRTLAQYNQAIQQTAHSLASEGLKSVSRNTLYDLRRMYANKIVPINKAAQSLASLTEQTRKLSLSDPTIMIGRMPTVQDLIDNPSYTPTILSGAQLYKQGIQASTTISNNNTDLNALVDNVASQYDLSQFDNPEHALNFIRQGISDGVAARNVELEEYRKKLGLQHAYSRANENRVTPAMRLEALKMGHVFDENNELVYDEETAKRVQTINQSKHSGKTSTSTSKSTPSDKIYGADGGRRDFNKTTDKEITWYALDKDTFKNLPESTKKAIIRDKLGLPDGNYDYEALFDELGDYELEYSGKGKNIQVRVKGGNGFEGEVVNEDDF